ncbi:MAG: hypothetical protein ABH844_01975 [Candidatus Omnitrophota bacterium]
MKSYLYRHRKVRLLGIGAAVVSLYFVNLYSPRFVEQVAEKMFAEFTNCHRGVEIGSITGGIFENIVFHDVAFPGVETRLIVSPRGAENSAKVVLERVEVSYSLWDFVKERLNFFPKKKQFFYTKIRFSRDNPFVNGEIALYIRAESVALKGKIKPLFLSEHETEIKGLFLKLDNSPKYKGYVLFSGEWKIVGEIDFANQTAEIDLVPFSEAARVMKIHGRIDSKGTIEVHSRIDKLKIAGLEIIGDLKAVFKNSRIPKFSLNAENLVINKTPFLDFSVNGYISPRARTIFFDNAQLGEGIRLRGQIETDAPYPVDMKLSVKGVRVEELAHMFGENRGLISGSAEADIHMKGPLKKSFVKGRIYVGDGNLGSMKFRSIFAGIEGMFPVLRIVDSRVVKDGGSIKVSGEFDLNGISDKKVFEKIVFETDNKVAVWKGWQISKEKEPHLAEMKKERVTLLTTVVGNDASSVASGEEASLQREMGVKYKIDAVSSIKLEFEEEKDFLGIEHKIEF